MIEVNAFPRWPKGYRALTNLALDLDLTSESAISGLTYTGSGGTRFDNTGTLVAATTNVRRVDYDPITLAARGTLVESQRTNLLLRSADFTNGAWTKTDTTVTADVLPAPDGTASMDRVTEGVAGTALLMQDATISAGATVTGSIFLRRGNHDWVSIACFTPVGLNGGTAYINLATGVIGSVANAGAGTNTKATVQAIGSGGVYRVTITTTTATGTTCRLQTRSASADGSATRVNNGERYHWGGQLEVGGCPTSYIPTAGSQVTRTADSLSLTGTAFSDWYNPVEGTLVVRWRGSIGTVGRWAVAATDGTTNNFVGIVASSSNGLGSNYTQVNTAGVQQAGVGGTTTPYVAGNQAGAGSYRVNAFAHSPNGLAVSGDPSGTLPTVSVLWLGSINNGTHLNGHLSRFTYYRTRFQNAALRALSA